MAQKVYSSPTGQSSIKRCSYINYQKTTYSLLKYKTTFRYEDTACHRLFLLIVVCDTASPIRYCCLYSSQVTQMPMVGADQSYPEQVILTSVVHFHNTTQTRNVQLGKQLGKKLHHPLYPSRSPIIEQESTSVPNSKLFK